MIFCFQAGKNRHEHIMESLELFGREVLPEFNERDEQLPTRQGTAPRAGIDAVMARKPAGDHPPLPVADYEFPAIPLDGRPLRRDDFHGWLRRR